MLTLTEYVQVDQWVNKIDESVVAVAESYSLGYDQENRQTVVKLHNENEDVIGEGRFDCAEMAIAVLEEYFEIDESDQTYNESYEWVRGEKNLNEALDSVEEFIEKFANEYQVRISHIDSDAYFDNLMGIEVFFHKTNSRNDLSSYIKRVSRELMDSYGAQSYDFDGVSWKIAL